MRYVPTRPSGREAGASAARCGGWGCKVHMAATGPGDGGGGRAGRVKRLDRPPPLILVHRSVGGGPALILRRIL